MKTILLEKYSDKDITKYLIKLSKLNIFTELLREISPFFTMIKIKNIKNIEEKYNIH